MERKRKIGMLLLAAFLLLSGWLVSFDHGRFLVDLLDAWHWQLPDKIDGILLAFTLLAFLMGTFLLVVQLAFFFNPLIKPAEILWILLGCVVMSVVLFPAFAMSRQERTISGCLTNQRELAIGFEIYAQDNHEQLPQGWDPIKFASCTFICPSTIRHFHELGGYGVNANLLGKNLNEIKDPATQLLIMDAKQMTSLIHSPDDIAFRHHGGFNAAFLDGHAKLITDMGKVRLQLNEQPRKK